jgi:hypothetical protein
MRVARLTLSSLCLLAMAFTNGTQAENKLPAELKAGGFFIGCQAYTFNQFSVFEAIEKTALAHNASAEVIAKVKA